MNNDGNRLMSVQVKDFWELDIAELLSSAQDFKDRGTHYFQVEFEVS